MKKVPLNPKHRARQKKIRKMLAAGLPLDSLMSGLDADCSCLQRRTTAGEPLPPAIMGEPFYPESLPAVHVVKKGDTLAVIARKYGTTAAKLKKLNGFSDKEPVQLKAGQKIKLK